MSTVEFSTGAGGSFIFTIRAGDLCAVATFVDVFRTAPEDWECLAARSAAPDFCPSNGTVGLGAKDGMAMFVFEKFGDCGDGSITVSIPFAAVQPALLAAADHRRSHPN